MTDLITRLRQRLGDAWRLNDEAADRIEELEEYLRNLAEITPHKWLKEEVHEILK